MDIQLHDDIKFKFINDSELDIYEYATDEPDDAVIQKWKAGDIEEATVIDVPGETYLTIQFPDSSVTYLPLSFVEILEINGE